MRHIGITYSMKRYPDGSGIEETAESYIVLPISERNAERVLTTGASHLVEGVIDRICRLQGYYFDGIKKVEKVT